MPSQSSRQQERKPLKWAKAIDEQFRIRRATVLPTPTRRDSTPLTETGGKKGHHCTVKMVEPVIEPALALTVVVPAATARATP